MRNKMSWLTVFAAIVFSASLSSANPSILCRDCPFPSKIADGRWLMPNGVLQLDINERPMPNHMSHLDITLRDVRTGDVVARGFVIQREERRTLTVDLIDKQGRQVRGYVRYVNQDKDKIQAKFTCEQCSIGPMLD